MNWDWLIFIQALAIASGFIGCLFIIVIGYKVMKQHSKYSCEKLLLEMELLVAFGDVYWMIYGFMNNDILSGVSFALLLIPYITSISYTVKYLCSVRRMRKAILEVVQFVAQDEDYIKSKEDLLNLYDTIKKLKDPDEIKKEFDRFKEKTGISFNFKEPEDFFNDFSE